jgi:cell division protein FtsB
MFRATGLAGRQRAAMVAQAFGGDGSVDTMSQEQELTVLQQQAQTLGQSLEQINQQIADLRSRQDEKE